MHFLLDIHPRLIKASFVPDVHWSSKKQRVRAGCALPGPGVCPDRARKDDTPIWGCGECKLQVAARQIVSLAAALKLTIGGTSRVELRITAQAKAI